MLLPLAATFVGCQAYSVHVPLRVETDVAAVATVRVLPDSFTVPANPAPAAEHPVPLTSLDLSVLWNLALANNSSLREAAAEVEAALGRRVQAAKYPNPRLALSQENLGTSVEPAGAVKVQIAQEILTAGKRPLDVAIAAKGQDDAFLALLGRKFDVLTRIRRAYYDYLGALHTLRVNEETVVSLEQGFEITRKQVEEAKTRPRTDLLRQGALLEEARIRSASSRVSLDAAWKQLAAETGTPELPRPDVSVDFPEKAPRWGPTEISQRVQEANTELKRAALDVQRAGLEMERGRAEAIPNVTLGGGYNRDFAENLQGAIINVETALPLWDRKQGRIHEAQARWVGAQAAQRTTATRLSRETTAAIARYETARAHVEKLTSMVVPQLKESVDLLRRSYQAGALQTTFADVLSAEQALYAARLSLVERQQAMWQAIADLQGLMQLDVNEELSGQ
jgi:cobalt-zinc-cadmium efflux system outer membrane protein